MFEFDASFIKPEVATEIQRLADLIEEHTEEDAVTREKRKPVLSIFGHADPVGNDDYNKQLSGRRAQAVYALLIRDVDLWEDLFSHPLGGDNWKNTAIQTMQAELGQPPGPVAGPSARKLLFRAYMDRLCLDATGKSFKVEKTDFLARGVDKGGKGDYQGCSEFNPIFLMSERDEQRFEEDTQLKADRDRENAPNRRVVAFLFRPGRRVDPQKWPCPRAKEGVAACKKRFWSDGEKRRSDRLPTEPRTFEKTQDTFACRFYDRISHGSPCERIRKTFEIRLYSPIGRAIALAPCEVTVGKRKPFADRADARGIITLRDVEVPATCKIRWGFPPDEGQEPELIFSLNLFLKADEPLESDRAEEGKRKLNNLGYTGPDPAENVRSFQREYGHLTSPPLDITGDLDDRTMKVLREVYQKSADDLRNTPVR